MSRNLKIFLLAALVCYAVGAMNDAPVMYVLSGLAAAVILICFLLSRLAGSRLRCDLLLPATRATTGRDIRGQLGVKSVGGITVPAVGLELSARNLTIPGVQASRRVLLSALRPGAELGVPVELKAPARGRYQVGPPELFDSDPIGMFSYRRTFTGTVQILVLPRTFDLPRMVAWEAGLGRPGGSRERAQRDHGDFLGIREHTPGDDLRHVHWKVTAHAGELVVKEYEPIRSDTVTIHLDLCAANHYGPAAASTLETAVSAAASLARAALGEQRFVALEGDGLPGPVSALGIGEPHLQRIMLALAEVKAEASRTFTQALSEQLTRTRRAGAVFIVTTAVEEALPEVAVAASRRGAMVTVLVVEGEPDEVPAPFAETSPRVVARLRSADIGVARLRSPAHLAAALLTARPFLRRRALGVA